MNILRQRLLAQQLSSPQFSTTHDLVSWMGFMQAQDYAQLPWAVGVRLKRASMNKFLEDYNTGRIIRTHLFRNTIQLVAAEDLTWMQKLNADRWLKTEESWVKQQGFVDSSKYGFLCDGILSLLEGGKSLTKDELSTALDSQKYMCGMRLFSHLLRVLEYKGLICSGVHKGRFATFALQSERVSQSVEMNEEEAVAILARRYFQSHGPASLEDFLWWTGLTKKMCLTAIADIGQNLIAEKREGETYYFCADARTRGCKSETFLLPGYEEYMIGYKTRHHAVRPEFTHRAHNSTGIFWPLVVHGGRVVGNWNAKLEIELFEDSKKMDVESAVLRYAKFKNV